MISVTLPGQEECKRMLEMWEPLIYFYLQWDAQIPYNGPLRSIWRSGWSMSDESDIIQDFNLIYEKRDAQNQYEFDGIYTVIIRFKPL